MGGEGRGEAVQERLSQLSDLKKDPTGPLG